MEKKRLIWTTSTQVDRHLGLLLAWWRHVTRLQLYSVRNMASFFVPRAVRSRGKQPGTRPPNKVSGVTRDARNSVVVDFTAKATEATTLVREIIEPAERPSETIDEIPKEGDSDDEEIVSYSKNQRWPAAGEPVCVVCGRYGAYICDKTDQDVCSLECKSRHLQSSLQKETPDSERKRHHTAASKIFGGPSGRAADIFSGHEDSKDRTQEQTTGACYKEHIALEGLSTSQVTKIRENLEIKVKGENVPKPILEFSHCQFPETLTGNLKEWGYTAPTPVQMQVIPLGLQGRDVLACAQTGSGKTAAFLLPTITRIQAGIAGTGMTGLVLSSRCTVQLNHVIGSLAQTFLIHRHQLEVTISALQSMRMSWHIWQEVMDVRRGCFPFVLFLWDNMHFWNSDFRLASVNEKRLCLSSLIIQ